MVLRLPSEVLTCRNRGQIAKLAVTEDHVVIRAVASGIGCESTRSIAGDGAAWCLLAAFSAAAKFA